MRKLLVGLAFTLGATAFAQAAVFGVTFDPLAPNGLAIGAQADVRVAHLTTATQPVHVTARLDLSAPLRFDLYPNANLGVTLRFPTPDATPYVGTGLGLWWTTIDGVPCWDLTWSVHGGLDVPLTGDLALRLDAQGAPLLGAYRVGVGVAIAVGD